MPEAGWNTGTVCAAGGSRNFKLWGPVTLERGRPTPLLMLLHGCSHDAKDMAEISGMNKLADLNGFLVVYPEHSRFANLLKCWNWFDPRHQTREAGEPSILAAVVEEIRAIHPVDPDRIFVVGVSAGGAMASILAATYPDIFAALAIFAGAEFRAAASVSEGFATMKHGGPDPLRQGQLAFEAMRSGLAQKKRKRMPAIVFHGAADTYVNPVNADQAIAQWSKTNECLAADAGDISFAVTEKVIEGVADGGRAFEKHVYMEGTNPLMEKWLVHGLGHAWSGSPERTKYGDPNGPNASAEIWRFFCEAASNSSSSPQLADSSFKKSNETTK